jgi:hypothetical protein
VEDICSWEFDCLSLSRRLCRAAGRARLIGLLEQNPKQRAPGTTPGADVGSTPKSTWWVRLGPYGCPEWLRLGPRRLQVCEKSFNGGIAPPPVLSILSSVRAMVCCPWRPGLPRAAQAFNSVATLGGSWTPRKSVTPRALGNCGFGRFQAWSRIFMIKRMLEGTRGCVKNNEARLFRILYFCACFCVLQLRVKVVQGCCHL